MLAAGIEETVGGATALGRAAGYGSVHDFMAIVQNPANLAVVPGNGDLGGELRIPIFHACFDRAFDPSVAYKPDAPGFTGDEYFGNVCNQGPLIPTGHFGWAQSFDSGWGYGLGFFSPAAIGAYEYGKDTINTAKPLDNERYPYTVGGLEYPNRQLLLSRIAIAGWLTAGVGWEPMRQLRLGASFGAGFAWIKNKNVVSAVGGTFQDAEIVSTVKVWDRFIPRAAASIVVAPTNAFELFGQLTYLGDIKANGYVVNEAEGFLGVPLRDCRSDAPGPHCRIDGVQLKVPFPTLEATVGLRYAARRTTRTRVLDPMKDERWDVSVEGFWSQTSHIEEFNLRVFKEGDPNPPKISFSTDPGGASPAGTFREAVIQRRWKDTYGFRAGGELSLIPNILSVRLGLSFSSDAVRNGYMNIDAFPVRKFGVHAGLSTKLGPFKTTIGYAHIFYRDVTVDVADARVTEIVALLPAAANAVNAGFYRERLDIISLQSNLSF